MTAPVPSSVAPSVPLGHGPLSSESSCLTMEGPQSIYDLTYPNTKFDGLITTNLLSQRSGVWPRLPSKGKGHQRPRLLCCCPRQIAFHTNAIEVLTHVVSLCADLWSPDVDGERVWHVRYYMEVGDASQDRRTQLLSKLYATLSHVVLTTTDELLAIQWFYMLCEILDVSQAVWSKLDYSLFFGNLKEMWRICNGHWCSKRDVVRPTALQHLQWLTHQLPSRPKHRGGALRYNFLFLWLRRDAVLHTLERQLRANKHLITTNLVCDLPSGVRSLFPSSANTTTPIWWLCFVNTDLHPEFRPALESMQNMAMELLGARPINDDEAVARPATDYIEQLVPHSEATTLPAAMLPEVAPAAICERCNMPRINDQCWCCSEDPNTALYDLPELPLIDEEPLPVFAPPSPIVLLPPVEFHLTRQDTCTPQPLFEESDAHWWPVQTWADVPSPRDDGDGVAS
jgi:hypothetical protein